MTPSRLRAWIRKYGTVGVLMAGAVLAWHLLWTRYRLRSLSICGLLLLGGVCLLFWPHPPRPVAPVLLSPAKPLPKPVVPADPREQANQALIMALRGLDTEAVRDALKAGANPNYKTKCEYTEGMESALEVLIGKQMQGNAHEEAPELNKLLLDYGADPNAGKEEGESPLVLMADFDYTTTVRYLLEHGADINAKDSQRCTALHYAVWHNNVKAVALLLTWGADVNVRDDRGKTPLMLHNPANTEINEDERRRCGLWLAEGDPGYHLFDAQKIRRLKRVGKADEKKIIRMLRRAGAK